MPKSKTSSLFHAPPCPKAFIRKGAAEAYRISWTVVNGHSVSPQSRLKAYAIPRRLAQGRVCDRTLPAIVRLYGKKTAGCAIETTVLRALCSRMILLGDMSQVNSGFRGLDLERFKMLDYDAGDGEIAKPLAIGRDDEPRGVPGAALRKRFLIGFDIFDPEAPLLIYPFKASFRFQLATRRELCFQKREIGPLALWKEIDPSNGKGGD